MNLLITSLVLVFVLGLVFSLYFAYQATSALSRYTIFSNDLKSELGLHGEKYRTLFDFQSVSGKSWLLKEVTNTGGAILGEELYQNERIEALRKLSVYFSKHSKNCFSISITILLIFCALPAFYVLFK